MCAIAGIIGPQEVGWIAAMCAVQAHRGPDGEGIHVDPSGRIALGHRRLSIIDLEGGAQPMANDDGSIRIVFNGEIFNAPALRARLESRGRRFATANSDTEVLIRLYEERGPDMLGDLAGMFAFALHDASRGILFCARDRMGIKPLYYSLAAGRFAFASELKALASLPFISRDLDPESLYHSLSLQFVPPPRSILADVRKVAPGQCLVVDTNSLDVAVRRYWDVRFAPDRSVPAGDWPDILRRAMRRAVTDWSLSDVPVACSLSGGLDSAAVTGMLAESSLAPVRTYTLGFSGHEGSDCDETALARLVAAKWGTLHHEIRIEPDDVLADLATMVHHLDEPYAGGLPSWYVFRAIGRDCKVAMTGVGGDELFGNYGKWTPFEDGPLARWRLALARQNRWGFLSGLGDALRYPHGHFHHRYLSDAAKDALLLNRDVLSMVGTRTEKLLEDRYAEGPSDARDAAAFVDFAFQLPEEFLLMTDRFSMAHGVEARTPLLDHELVELAFTVPAHLRTKRRDLKHLMRETVRPYLPDQLLTAPKKGFVLPLRQWTRGKLRGLVESLLSPNVLRAQGLFNPLVWTRLVEPHLDGRADNTPQVWTLAMFQLWHRGLGGTHAP